MTRSRGAIGSIILITTVAWSYLAGLYFTKIIVAGLTKSEAGSDILGIVLKFLESILSQVTQVAW
jgi:hypothetical protein